MSSGAGKRSEIDKVSGETKNLIRKLIAQQQQAHTRGTAAMSQDLELFRQQIGQQNAQTAAIQNWQSQAIQAQEGLAKQYQTGLSQQLGLLQQQNSLIKQQGAQQTSYYNSQRQFQQEQRALQQQQLARQQEEGRYTSLLESNERRQAGASANRLRLQINRRRAISRLGRV